MCAKNDQNHTKMAITTQEKQKSMKNRVEKHTQISTCGEAAAATIFHLCFYVKNMLSIYAKKTYVDHKKFNILEFLKEEAKNSVFHDNIK